MKGRELSSAYSREENTPQFNPKLFPARLKLTFSPSTFHHFSFPAVWASVFFREDFLYAECVCGCVDADAAMCRLYHADGDAMFEGAELFEFLGHLQRGGGEADQSLECVTPIAVDAEMEQGDGTVSLIMGVTLQGDSGA